MNRNMPEFDLLRIVVVYDVQVEWVDLVGRLRDHLLANLEQFRELPIAYGQ